ncbi:hypothetical protein B0H13DRAFT_1908701 [Mycena leptocephala]|nr:hypothetical protein B0H13DRAFT_1908701 [Mycena leptocephala]
MARPFAGGLEIVTRKLISRASAMQAIPATWREWKLTSNLKRSVLRGDRHGYPAPPPSRQFLMVLARENMPLFSSVLCSILLAGLARVVQVWAGQPIQTCTRTRTRGHPHALETGNQSKKPRRRGSKGLNAAIFANHSTNGRQSTPNTFPLSTCAKPKLLAQISHRTVTHHGLFRLTGYRELHRCWADRELGGAETRGSGRKRDGTGKIFRGMGSQLDDESRGLVRRETVLEDTGDWGRLSVPGRRGPTK